MRLTPAITSRRLRLNRAFLAFFCLFLLNTCAMHADDLVFSRAVKLTIYVPETHADAVRQAAGDAGAGKIGNYSHCSFSCKGTGRFLPLKGAKPAIGSVGQPETVVEERIELDCPRTLIKEVLAAIRRAHPYEEPAIDIQPVYDLP